MPLTLQSLLADYSSLPDFMGLPVCVNMRGNFGNTLLHAAAVRGIPEEVLVLLGAGAEVNARGEHGYSPLHEAAAHGKAEVVSLLLAHGASPTATNDDGETPGRLAALLQQVHLAGLL